MRTSLREAVNRGSVLVHRPGAMTNGPGAEWPRLGSRRKWRRAATAEAAPTMTRSVAARGASSQGPLGA